MRITGTGHAGMRIDTDAGSILCDPWVNPAYFASWFPFPDNSGLDWERLGDTDYLYVSHLHRDHFDAAHLRRFVHKRATVLLPRYPTSELEDQLRELGFTTFIRTVTDEVVELDGGLKIMIQALTSPTDGPIGDSSLWVEHRGVRLLNQNDARPTDLAVFTELGHVHAHLLQFSGAIWYPMVYELPSAAKAAFGKQKRERQFDRTFRYIDELQASWVFPIAGPPCFLDEELWQLNDLPGGTGRDGTGRDGTGRDGTGRGEEGNIFPDQSAFVAEYRKVGGENSVVLLPGTVATLDDESCAVSQPVDDLDAFFAGKERYLTEYARRQRSVIEVAKASWRHPEIDVLTELKRRVEPLLEESLYLAQGVAGPVRLDLVSDPSGDPDSGDPGSGDPDSGRATGADGGSVEPIVIDFPGKQVRRYADEKVRYRFRMRRELVEHLLHTGEVDWVNSLFLSCRFSAVRIGQYNEFVYAFFKCLSEERLQYAEGWYDEQGRTTDTEDITVRDPVSHCDWVVQRRCPHLKADLTRFGIVEGGTLTCQLHGWRFDLATGRCLTSVGHDIRAHRANEVVPAPP